jgi:hypothetical protein
LPPTILSCFDVLPDLACVYIIPERTQ